MNRHPRFAALRRFERAEPSGEEDARVNDHLAECRRCQNVVRRVRAIRTGAAELLDPPAPEDSWAVIQERLDAGEAVLLPGAGARSSGPWLRARHLAGLALILGASAATAFVGPPIATWAASLFDPPPVADAPPEAGFATLPQSGQVLVKLTANTADVTVRVRRAPSPLLEVRGRGAAAEAGFVITGETIEVVGATGGEILLLIPEGISARLTTGSSVLLLDDSVDILVPAIDEQS